MHILRVLGTKGGCGKSTVAVALAVEAARRGMRVGLVDFDGGQRSLTYWWAMRTEGGQDIGTIAFEPPEENFDYAITLAKAATGPFDVVISDGPPAHINRTATAMARDELRALGGDVLADVDVADRTGYAAALLHGRSLPEQEKGKQRPAGGEIAALWDAIEKRLQHAKAPSTRERSAA